MVCYPNVVIHTISRMMLLCAYSTWGIGEEKPANTRSPYRRMWRSLRMFKPWVKGNQKKCPALRGPSNRSPVSTEVKAKEGGRHLLQLPASHIHESVTADTKINAAERSADACRTTKGR
ncbi:unnamed protein product [Soboliphyme baturini]|uniref:Secreted protein n=1 Tax=Soboliphyme baturini TaxID=241478 RepID=A0A183J0H1_9BILA|nr:unnamed protein product [Soboliphyme baturini]